MAANVDKLKTFILGIIRNCKNGHNEDQLEVPECFSNDTDFFYKIFEEDLERMHRDGEFYGNNAFLFDIIPLPENLAKNKNFILELCQLELSFMDKSKIITDLNILNYCSKELLGDKDFALSLLDGYVTPHTFSLFSDKLKDDEDIATKALTKESIYTRSKKRIKDIYCGDMLRHISTRLRDSKDFVLRLAEKFKEIKGTIYIVDCSYNLRNDRSLTLQLASVGVLRSIPKEFSEDKELLLIYIKNSTQLYDCHHFLQQFNDDRDVILSLAEIKFLSFQMIPAKFKLDKDILLEVGKHFTIAFSEIDPEIKKDKVFIHKLTRYRIRESCRFTSGPKENMRISHNKRKCNKYEHHMITAANDYIKMGKYETVVRTILKLDLPIELSRNVCKFL